MVHEEFNGLYNLCYSRTCNGRLDFVHKLTALHRKLKFLNGLYKTNSLVVKECFHNVRYDVRFRKLC